MSMAPDCGKHILPSVDMKPLMTMCQSIRVGYGPTVKESYAATIFGVLTSCDLALRTYFLVTGLVMENPAQASALQSQMVKRRNGLHLWSDMWKWPSGLMCILIHHHGNGHIIYRCVGESESPWMHVYCVPVLNSGDFWHVSTHVQKMEKHTDVKSSCALAYVMLPWWHDCIYVEKSRIEKTGDF